MNFLEQLVLQNIPGDPTSPVNGGLWYNTTTNEYRGYQNSALVDLISSGSTVGGDLTGSYPDPTIANGAVTLAKMDKIAANSIIGNNTGAFGFPTALIGTDVTAMLDVFSSTLKGLAPASGGGATNFLRADGTWAVPAGGGGVTNVTGTAPVVSSGGTTPAISIPAASNSVDGYLKSTDWATFNNKQAALVSATNIKTINGTSILGSGDLVVSGGGGTTTNPLIIKADSGTTEGTDLYTFDGSSAKTINIVAGTNITITKTAGTLTISSTGGSSSAVSSDHPVTLMTAFLNYT